MLVYISCQIVELPYTRRRVPSSHPHILTPHLLIDISVCYTDPKCLIVNSSVRGHHVRDWCLPILRILDLIKHYRISLTQSLGISSSLAPRHPIEGSWNPQYLSQAASTTLQTATQLSTFPVQFDIFRCANYLCYVKLQHIFPAVRYLSLALQDRCQFVLIFPGCEM